MSGPRNRYGCNDQADCYRTIGGSKYLAWISFPSPELIAAYREAGLKCRRFGDELFLLEDHVEEALSIDRRYA